MSDIKKAAKRKTNNKSKKKRNIAEATGKEKTSEVIPEKTLKQKLREKLREKQLFRTSQYARDNMYDDLREKLKDKKISEEDKEKIRKKMDLLKDIEDKQEANRASEFPEYVDNCSYGGGLEHPE